MKAAAKSLYQKLKSRQVRCLACQRQCVILPNGGTGFCRVRQNRQGKLYSLTYGLITGVQIDPIEKKPLAHFHPNTMVASFGSYGCNFKCKQCLNYFYSRSLPPDHAPSVTPQKLVKKILSAGWPGIAFTYNEPAITPEFVHDTVKLAKKAGLFTVMVTNGSWTKQALDYYGRFIDAANIDFKGFSAKTYQRQGAKFGQIPQMAKYAQKKYQIHLEITTLLIPGINDSPNELKRMTRWIAKNLGSKTPWHLSRFDPDLAPDPEFQKIPLTSQKQIQKAAQIGRSAGLKIIHTPYI